MVKLLELVLDDKYVISSGGANITHYNLNFILNIYNNF